jgi:hypothetical protein
MADKTYDVAAGAKKTLKDMGDGTHAEVVSIKGDSTAPVPTIDTASAPVAITPHDVTTFTPSNHVIIEVSSPGNIKFGWPNGVTMTMSFPLTGTYQRDWAINQIFVTGSTATFSAWKAN